MNDVEDLVTNAIEQKPLDFSNAFQDILLNKIQDAVDNKKIEIADKIFNDEEPDENEEVEDEEQEEPED